MQIHKLHANIIKLLQIKPSKDNITFQLRYWKKDRKDEILQKKIKPWGITITNPAPNLHLLVVKRGEKICKAAIITLGPEHIPNYDLFEHATPVLTITACKRPEREMLSKTLTKLGIHRGWIKQRLIRSIHEIAEEKNLNFELLTLVYELRMYKGMLFRAAGTANFWPKGVSSVEEAIQEYLLPFAEKTDFYIFIKSIQFKIRREETKIGRYTVDRWGRITAAPGSNIDFALNMLDVITEQMIENYIAYRIGYKVSTVTKKNLILYSLEDAKTVWLEAKIPGATFFKTAKMLLKQAAQERKMIILPIEVGNPRYVSTIIDKKTGSAAIITITYQGLRLTPAPGTQKVSTELVDSILTMFQGLLME